MKSIGNFITYMKQYLILSGSKYVNMHTYACKRVCVHTHAHIHTHTHWGALIPPLNTRTENINERKYLQYHPGPYALVQRTWVDKGRNHVILKKVEFDVLLNIH